MRLARSVKELTELIRFNRRDMQVGHGGLDTQARRGFFLGSTEAA